MSDFELWLEDIASNGISAVDFYLEHGTNSLMTFLPDINLTESQRVIIDALMVVSKIGDGKLKAGIERLTKNYPENIHAINSHGWGKKPNKRPPESRGKQRAIVELVRQESAKGISQKDACENLSIKLRKFEKLRAQINAIDKKRKEKLLKESGSNKRGIELDFFIGTIYLDYSRYIAELENKYKTPMDMPELEFILYSFMKDSLDNSLNKLEKTETT